MVDSRNSIQLEASGTLTTGVKDRYEAADSIEITEVAGVVGTAPTGGPLVVQVRKDTVVIATLTFADGGTEAAADVIANLPTQDNQSQHPYPGPQSASPTTIGRVTAGQTVDINVLTVGATVAGADLDVTVVYTDA